MTKTITFAFLLLTVTKIYGQNKSYDVGFPLYSDPGRFYSLDLKKDHSYTHELFYSLGDGVTILDSGTYTISEGKVIFHSLKKGDNSFDGKTYFLKVESKKKIPYKQFGL